MKSDCCNSSCIPLALKIANKDALFFHKTKVFRVHLVLQICEKCGKEIPFDGREYGIVNFNNSYLFCCELFYELLNLKSLSGLTTNAW